MVFQRLTKISFRYYMKFTEFYTFFCPKSPLFIPIAPQTFLFLTLKRYKQRDKNNCIFIQHTRFICSLNWFMTRETLKGCPAQETSFLTSWPCGYTGAFPMQMWGWNWCRRVAWIAMPAKAIGKSWTVYWRTCLKRLICGWFQIKYSCHFLPAIFRWGKILCQIHSTTPQIIMIFILTHKRGIYWYVSDYGKFFYYIASRCHHRLFYKTPWIKYLLPDAINSICLYSAHVYFLIFK